MRDEEIDVLRGYCIASMVFSHFASGSILSKLLHISPYFDGASGFVFLSGLVLGRVVRSRVFGLGLKGALFANVKRVFEIYLYHLLIVFVFVVFSQLNGISEGSAYFGSGVNMLLDATLLKLAPAGGSVLRLYVAMMMILTVVIALVARGRQLAALFFSVGFYLFARYQGDLFSFQVVHGDEGVGANWGAWQLLFVLSFLVGWNWSILKIDGVLKRHAAALVFLLFFALASSHYLRGSEYGPYLAGSWFNKTQMGFGRIFYAFVIMAGLYALGKVCTNER